jgi:hypothetical protein
MRIVQDRGRQKGRLGTILMRLEHALLISRGAATLAASVLIAGVLTDGVADRAFGLGDRPRRGPRGEHGNNRCQGKQSPHHALLPCRLDRC